MGFHIVKQREDGLQKIAQIMSEQTTYKVNANDIRLDVDTATTSIYSTVVYEKVDDSHSIARSIICTVRKGRKQNKYEVKTEKLI